MFYYLVKYSFDADKPVFGPFNTEEEAWNAALTDAQREFNIDKNENEWDVEMATYECYGEIILTDHFTGHDDTTEWLIFKL